MREVGAFEAKNTLGGLLDSVERQGEEIIITRHGRPVARLAPVAGAADREQARIASQRIRARAEGMKCAEFDWEILKLDRDRGRP